MKKEKTEIIEQMTENKSKLDKAMEVVEFLGEVVALCAAVAALVVNKKDN